jgi:hypothetical protein
MRQRPQNKNVRLVHELVVEPAVEALALACLVHRNKVRKWVCSLLMNFLWPSVFWPSLTDATHVCSELTRPVTDCTHPKQLYHKHMPLVARKTSEKVGWLSALLIHRPYKMGLRTITAVKFIPTYIVLHTVMLSRCQSVIARLFLFLSIIRIWTQDLMLARQARMERTILPALFVVGSFKIRSQELFAWAGLKPQSFWSLPLK